MRPCVFAARIGLRLLPVLALLGPSGAVSAQAPAGLPPEALAAIDSAATAALASTGTPSVSIAVVKDGAIAYLHAYGQARLDPPMPATPAMRYCIGSISKQFTAATMAMLADEHRLGLDDDLAKFFPDLTRARDITVRQLLSHTAGIRDFWPQDYMPAFMLEPVTPRGLMDRWARQPLDFEPGTRWQYSNTGFVIAGAIAEKVSGRPFMDLLRERIFTPLGMSSAVDVERNGLDPGDAAPYASYALGPQRLAPQEGKGWMFAAGALAMTAEDLARWDLALIDLRLLSPAAMRELTTEVMLRDGVGSGYALGLDVALVSGRRMLSHGGAVNGFTAHNRVYPDDRAAIVVLTNSEASAGDALADRIAEVLFLSASPADAQKMTQVIAMFLDLQRGTIDRSLLTANCSAYFGEQALADFRSSLGPLGLPGEFKLKRQGLRGGFVTRVYGVTVGGKSLQITTRAEPAGRFEEYQVFPD